MDALATYRVLMSCEWKKKGQKETLESVLRVTSCY